MWTPTAEVAVLPNFFIVGAMKCGTTSLAAQLAEHPQVHMSPAKEPAFFSEDENWTRGVGWYEEFFTGSRGETVVGEASTTYSKYPVVPAVPRRMAQVLDMAEIRLLYLVRDPIERMISHYMHDWYQGHTKRSFDQELAVNRELEAFSHYHRQMEQYSPYVSPEQWQIVVLEDLAVDPRATHRSIYKWLGIEEDFVPPDLSARNVTSKKIRRSVLAETARRYPRIKTLARRWVPRKIRGRLTRVGGTTRGRPDLSPALYNELLSRFDEDVAALSEFTKRDLTAVWGWVPR